MRHDVRVHTAVVSFYLLLCTALWALCGKALYKNVFIIIIIIVLYSVLYFTTPFCMLKTCTWINLASATLPPFD